MYKQNKLPKNSNRDPETYLRFPLAELEDTQEAFFLCSAQTGSAGANGVYEKKPKRKRRGVGHDGVSAN